MPNSIMPVLHSAVIIMTPLLFAATGGYFTKLAGMLNIALEGLLLAGAFAAITAMYFTGNFAAGIAAAVFASVALSALLAFAILYLRSNVFISGLAINLLAGGLTIVLSHYIFNTRGVVALQETRFLPLVEIPLIADIPVISRILSGYSVYVYAGWLLLVLAGIAVYKTPFGYRLRACEKHTDVLISLGISPVKYRFAAFIVSGFFCGIGGSFLSLNLGAFVPNMTAGKGWIALVVIFLGGRKPPGLFAAAFVFGLTEAFSNYAQGPSLRALNIPADLILAIPYLFMLIAMVLVSIREKNPVSGR